MTGAVRLGMAFAAGDSIKHRERNDRPLNEGVLRGFELPRAAVDLTRPRGRGARLIEVA